jgi:thioredoxin reductase
MELLPKKYELKKLDTTSGDFYAKSVLIATGSELSQYWRTGRGRILCPRSSLLRHMRRCFLSRQKTCSCWWRKLSRARIYVFNAIRRAHIDLLVRGPKFRASDVLQHELEKHKNKIDCTFQYYNR